MCLFLSVFEPHIRLNDGSRLRAAQYFEQWHDQRGIRRLLLHRPTSNTERYVQRKKTAEAQRALQ